MEDEVARKSVGDAHTRIDGLLETATKLANSCVALETSMVAHIKECDRARKDEGIFRAKTSANFGKLFDRWFWLMVIVAGGSLSVTATLFGVIAAIKGAI